MNLNVKEQKKFEIIKKVAEGTISKKDAENILELSRKQINRLIKIFYEFGKEGFIHKNRGKISPNKKDSKMLEEIKELYFKEYYDYNFEAFYEVIENKYDISYSTMYNEFSKDDMVSPIANRKTMKLYNEKMKNTISKISSEKELDELTKNKVELYKTRKLEADKAYVRRSSNWLGFGQEIQMDACFKIWFSNVSSALHLAVDKATKKVLFGWFEYEEITRGYFVVLMHIILNYGIPYKIKADNRSSFFANNNKKDKLNTTQFSRICRYLDIILETSSNAVSKANVERENGTFKNRLIAELRHENILDIDSANEYLNKIFIPKMNKKFSYEIDTKNSKMKHNDYTYDELNLIIAEEYTRLVDNASSISFEGKYYVPVDIETGEIISYKHRTECIVIIAYDGSMWCKIEENFYHMQNVAKREKINKTTEENNGIQKEKKKYIPPSNHPWRKDMKKFFNKS